MKVDKNSTVQIMASWPLIRPIYAGVFARAVYPEEKTFFMTFQFELSEPVDAGALKTAWKKTCDLYPMLNYAVVKRDHQYYLAEDKLDFVFAETAQRIEPTKAVSNYHAVAMGYDGNILNVFIDHTIMDGTGCRPVFETLFYYYYCAADHIVYPVPEGVQTLEGGPIEGLEDDAFKKVDPMDPQNFMGGAPDAPPVFILPEGDYSRPWLGFDVCRRYVVSAPSDEFMAYARRVKGSPMSVLAQLLVQTVERLHPENARPMTFMAPVSVRKAMGTENSLLNQVVFASYTFDADGLLDDDRSPELNAGYRAFLKGFTTEGNLRMLTGIYAGLIDSYKKAIAADALAALLEKAVTETTMATSISGSYIGTIKTGEYGSRIRLNAFHVMDSAGTMVQMAEVGGSFSICWFASFDGEKYVADLAAHMRELGIPHAQYKAVKL